MLSTIYNAYARAGFHLAAQPARDKAGLGHKPGDFSYTGLDADGAIDWLKRMGGNVSVTAVGQCAFLDFDIDASPSVRENLLLKVKTAIGGMNAWRHRTPRGGMHILVNVQTDKVREGTRVIEFPNGHIDVKGFGLGYVIGPGSKTPDGEYVGYRGSVTPNLDDSILNRLLLSIRGELRSIAPTVGVLPDTPFQADGTEPELEELEHYLGFIQPSIKMSEWTRVVFGSRSHYQNGLSDAAMRIVDRWSAGCSRKYKEREVAGMWRSRDTAVRPATFASVVKLAMDSGAPVFRQRPRPILPIPTGDWSDE